MKIRFYIDEVTKEPHIYKHRVAKDEVRDILFWSGEDRQGKNSSRIAIGRTQSGRYLRVIYVPDPVPDSVFVITAYELRGKPLAAYKRRRKKRR